MPELNNYGLAVKMARIEQLKAQLERQLAEIMKALGLDLGGPKDPNDAPKDFPA